MSWLEFISAMFGHVVWPLVVVVVVYLLRDPLRRLLSSGAIRRVKAGPGGLEVEYWDSQLDDARERLELEPTEEPSGPTDEQVRQDFVEEMRELARISPRAAVLESHARLEHLLRAVVDVPTTSNGRRGPFPSMRALTRAAVEQELISPNEARILDELSVLRNAVAHTNEPQIGYDRAVEYAKLALDVAISTRLALGHTATDAPPL